METTKPKPDSSPPATLVAAKLLVMASCPYLRKSKAQGLNYSFASERELLRMLHPALVAAGLTLSPERVECIHRERYKTAKGTDLNYVAVKVHYRLRHVNGESEEGESIGEAMDAGDKAAGKALTAALKPYLRQTFLIETGDDPDRTPSDAQERAPQRPVQRPVQTPAQANGQPAEPREPRINQEEAQTIAAMMRERGVTFQQLVAKFPCGGLRQLAISQYRLVTGWLAMQPKKPSQPATAPVPAQAPLSPSVPRSPAPQF